MNLPKDFIIQTRALLGEERFALLEKGLEMAPSTSIRFNPFKVSSASVSTALAPQQVPWCNEGYYLQNALTSLSIRCFMQVAIMFKRLHLCFYIIV